MAILFNFTLDRVQTAVLGYAFGVRVARHPLVLPRIDTDPERLLHSLKVSLHLLRKRRLHSDGVVSPRVRTAFGLFATGRVEVALSGIADGDRHYGALGLSDGRQALVVDQEDGSGDVCFRLLQDEDWVDALASLAPPMPAGPGRELVVDEERPVPRSAFATRRAQAVDADVRETRMFEEEPVMSMVRPPERPFHGRTRSDRDLAADVLMRERLGSGRMTAGGRGRNGPRRTDPVVWFDTTTGRYLLHTVSSDASTTIRLRPGGSRELAGAIRDAVGVVY